MKKIHKVKAAISAVYIMAADCAAEQIKPESSNPEPLVLNTVDQQDDIVLTVMHGEETVPQYEGAIEL